MEVKKCFDDLFSRLGEDLTVIIDDNTTELKAIIQPMRYKNKLYINMAQTELGFNDTECFLYLGPPECDFTGKERQTAIFSADGDRAYNVSRADRIAIGGEKLYIWAVLMPRIKEGEYETL